MSRCAGAESRVMAEVGKTSRRLVFVAALLGTALVVAVAVVPRALQAPRHDAPTPLQRAPLPAAAEAIEHAHGVRIALDPVPRSTWPEVTYGALGPGDAPNRDRYLRRLRDELGRYPRAFLARSGLRTIAVVKNLAYAGQPRAAVPDPYQGVLYLDAACAANNPQYEQHVIHHEYFHYVQGARHRTPYADDPAWRGFNPPDFRYGDGGASTRDPNVTPLTHPAPGFINRYAQSAPEEDMAEVFAALRVTEERQLIERWAREDEHLKRKVAYLEKFFEDFARADVPTPPPATAGPR